MPYLRWGLVALFTSLAAYAQDKPKPIAAHEKVDQEKVDKAIQEGCKSLLKGQAFGTFTHGRRNQPEALQSYTELALLTLAHSGYYTDSDPQVQALVSAMMGRPPSSTYTASLRAMALQKLDWKKYQLQILECAQFLCDNQCENGQWDYGEIVPIEEKIPSARPKGPKPPAPAPDVATGGEGDGVQVPPPLPGAPAAAPKNATTATDPSKKGGRGTKAEEKIPRIPVRKRKPGPPNGDNSNAQYAALGVRACLDAYIDMDPKVLHMARKWWLDAQNSDGGWGYNDRGDKGGGANETGVSNDSYGSMTVGAVGALCIYDHFMGINYKSDGAVLKGVDWMGKNFELSKNPMKSKFATLYYLYGLERAGILFGTEKFGTHEWYPEGANHLLSTQQAGGAWSAGDTLPKEAMVDTCFAVLFLRRGTMPLRREAVATGRPLPGAPVANGVPVPQPQGGGGNVDPGLVVNKSVQDVAAGWRLLNCPPNLQRLADVGGKTGVLVTQAPNLKSMPTFRQHVRVAQGPAAVVRATVGCEEGKSWNLLIRIDGTGVTSKTVNGWTTVTHDLSAFSGKDVLVELVAEGSEPSWWAEIKLGS